MADAELDAIRQRRLAQLSGGNASPSGPSGGQQQGGPEEAAARAAEEEESRRTIMSQILDPQARERLSRIALVRPERARSLEQLIVRMARSGQIRGRVNDEQLLSLLDQVAQAESGGASGGGSSRSKITVQRRQDKLISDDEDDDDDFMPSSSRTQKSGTDSKKANAATDDDDDDIFDL
ncbi:hypothetical protein P389DRAFT_188149 [Cystobasidium minutum MCA 4210]|uniref:uncharacterized protein n=1 Tax=Cystobasidium minutum MCA 4210 TaxID=1397322 RepID=UPI0034CE0479|eukprot:jgi/Rhomi1/188149/estExt_fgenesh1_pg.C_2_t10449